MGCCPRTRWRCWCCTSATCFTAPSARRCRCASVASSSAPALATWCCRMRTACCFVCIADSQQQEGGPSVEAAQPQRACAIGPAPLPASVRQLRLGRDVPDAARAGAAHRGPAPERCTDLLLTPIHVESICAGAFTALHRSAAGWWPVGGESCLPVLYRSMQPTNMHPFATSDISDRRATVAGAQGGGIAEERVPGGAAEHSEVDGRNDNLYGKCFCIV